MKEGLFHRDIGLPDCAPLFFSFELTYSAHAKRACVEDRYGTIRPPRFVRPREGEIIEVQVWNGRIVKAVVRTTYNDIHDLILVIVPEDIDKAFVKTCWLNRKDDTHCTLDRSKYQTYVVS